MAITLTLLVLVLAGSVNTLRAEETPAVEIEPIVVTASRIPTSLAEISESTTLITREEIEVRQPISAIDLLRHVPGLHIDQPGGRGSVSSVYLRGGDPNFTVVLIDGIKVNDPTNSRGGSFDFSTLDLGGIERVEIVRGPLSSVYGSDAMAGVINIVTHSGTATPTTSVHLSSGRHDYYRAGISTRGPLGIHNYTLNFSYIDNGAPVEGSEFIGRSVNAKVSISPSGTTRLELVSRYASSDSESFPDDSGGPKFAVLRGVDRRNIEELTGGATFGHEVRSWWRFNIKADYYGRREEVSSPGVAPGKRNPFGIPANSSDNGFRRTNLSAGSHFSSPSARASIGIDIQLEEGDSNGVLGGAPTLFELDRAIYAPFLEAQYASSIGLTVQGGVRIDYPEDFSSEVTGRVGLLYRIVSTETTLKANWGEGFKLPSFFALGHPFVGDPGLVPETSEGFDIGIGQAFGARHLSVSGTYFHTRSFNLIDFDEIASRLVNRSEVTAEGVELDIAFRPADNLSIKGHLTYLETDIEGTAEELRNRPEWRGGLNTNWRPNAELVLSLDLLHVGDVPDSSIFTGDQTLDDYLRVDVAATWTPFTHWRFSFAVDNLFDADYEEAVGFPAPGITPRIAVRATF
ncbi:MAG: TonB-dependent receptor plug domain-containing protein [Nitrospiria bacterium]